MEKFENNNFKLYEYLFTSWIITVGNAMSRHRRDFLLGNDLLAKEFIEN